MALNSENVGATVKMFQCRGRPNLSEDTCQKPYEFNQNWTSYEQKETTYFKEAFLQVLTLK